jgi:aminopeptidase N
MHHSGFYRVNYDLNNWNKLVNQLHENHSLIDPISRAQLIDDSFNLARAELLSFTVYLKLIEYLRNETHGMPFDTALDGLFFIDRMLSYNYTIHKAFKVK